MTAEQKLAELRDWLARTNRTGVVSGDGYVPLPIAAEAIGVSCSTLRRWRDEDKQAVLRFRDIGAGRGKVQVRLDTLAAYAAAADVNG